MTDLAASIAQRCFWIREGNLCYLGGGSLPLPKCTLCPNWRTSKGGPDDPHTWFDLSPVVRGRMPQTGIQGVFVVQAETTRPRPPPRSPLGLAAWDREEEAGGGGQGAVTGGGTADSAAPTGPSPSGASAIPAPPPNDRERRTAPTE